MISFLPPSGDEEQGVVDRDAQADQGDQELDDERDVGEIGEGQQQEEGGQDRDGRHHQWQEREQGREHEQQDRQRAERSEEGLGEDAVSARVVTGRQRVHPGDPDDSAGGRGALDRFLHDLGRDHVGEALGERVEDHRVRRTVVGRAEGLVAGGGLVDHPQWDVRRADRCEGLGHLGLVAGDGLALGQGDRREQRRGVPAVVERRDDLVGGRVAWLSGQGEVDGHPVGDRAGDRAAGDGDHHPGHHDQQSVPQHHLAQTTHGRSLPVTKVRG